jgi:hypothetical protein
LGQPLQQSGHLFWTGQRNGENLGQDLIALHEAHLRPHSLLPHAWWSVQPMRYSQVCLKNNQL